MKPMRRIGISALLVLVFSACASTGPSPKAPPTLPTTDMPMATTPLSDLAALSPMDFPALSFLQLVHQLDSLDADGLCGAVELYLVDHPESTSAPGLFFLLRFALQAPAGASHPPIRIGHPLGFPPFGPEATPQYPLWVVRGVPFCLITGYALGGFPEPVTAHLELYRSDLERAPELPPAPDTWEEIESSVREQWTRDFGHPIPDDMLARLKGQFR